MSGLLGCSTRQAQELMGPTEDDQRALVAHASSSPAFIDLLRRHPRLLDPIFNRTPPPFERDRLGAFVDLERFEAWNEFERTPWRTPEYSELERELREVLGRKRRGRPRRRRV